MNIGYYKSILIITIIFYVIFVILNTPYGTSEPYTVIENYTEQEPYTVIENYTEQEPYTIIENYTEQEPYTVIENYTEQEPYQEILYSGKLFVKGSNGPKYIFYGATKIDKEYIENNEYNYAICWSERCEIHEYIYRAEISESEPTTKYRDVQKSRPKTVYRDVQKSRPKTVYRDVQKSRPKTVYRDVQKSRPKTVYREIRLSLIQRTNRMIDNRNI